ncbi:MAG: ZIP family metal transporter [Treponema sp.]|nr:ZIP family metal transporter [Treponema sp.]
MTSYTILGLLIPFAGTALGSSSVFFMTRGLNDTVQRFLLGFAGGVMTAASVWSLLIPAISMTEASALFAPRLEFIPALAGFSFGILFLFILDCITPHLHAGDHNPEGPRSQLSRTAMLVFAVTLHNIPEGMAVGVLFAGLLSGTGTVTLAAAFALSVGIAIQNFPEGAIISMPLRTEGNGRFRSFLYGMLSGAVEPVAALITILLTGAIEIALPYLLSFAAGAMMYVVIEELIPEATRDEKTNTCTIGFAIGFALMMVLDVALG